MHQASIDLNNLDPLAARRKYGQIYRSCMHEASMECAYMHRVNYYEEEEMHHHNKRNIDKVPPKRIKITETTNGAQAPCMVAFFENFKTDICKFQKVQNKTSRCR
jgi:hypothetical protein